MTITAPCSPASARIARSTATGSDMSWMHSNASTRSYCPAKDGVGGVAHGEVHPVSHAA